MQPTMRRSIVFLFALILGLLCSLPAPVGARATRIPVVGDADLADDIVGDIWTDRAGNVHFHQVSQQGNFALKGDGIAIQGQQTVLLNGLLDASFSTGVFAGTYTVSTGLAGRDTVLWEGHVHGRVVDGSFHGLIQAHGRGPFYGMLLQLDIQEVPPRPDNPRETFTLTGWVRDLRGQ